MESEVELLHTGVQVYTHEYCLNVVEVRSKEVLLMLI